VTHEVTNQSPPLVGYDLADNPALLEAVSTGEADWAQEDLHRVGRLAGSAECQEWARLAEKHPPTLRTHDRYGSRIDVVDYEPAYHQLMRAAVQMGLAGAPWSDTRPGAHVARAAKMFLWGQLDAGHCCSISMTYAVVPALRANPELAARYEPLLTAPVYDPGLRPAFSKSGLLAGMSMTEKQGGSDVRAGTTRASPQSDGSFLLTGHKWFTSAPMSDLFLVLAQAPGGLSCFLLPRVLPDGGLNGMNLQRLKDKLGNRSNASAEVEYDQALAWLVGPEDAGVRTIIEMVNATRLDCILWTAGIMRAGVEQAAHHASHRTAFGRKLRDQPLMQNVLADLAVEAEAAIALAIRLAAATDRSTRGVAREALLRRLGLAAGKYTICKRGPAHAAEALECLGGNGYIEESILPKLYREAPLESVWEGSGNVVALDTIRAMSTQPETVDVFFEEVALASGEDQHLDAAVRRLKQTLATQTDQEKFSQSRRVAEQIAFILQGSLLVRHSHPDVASVFCRSRLGGEWGAAYGTLPSTSDYQRIVARATPAFHD
jgi:putative acyl-CoA dehydrogenase